MIGIWDFGFGISDLGFRISDLDRPDVRKIGVLITTILRVEVSTK